MCLHKLIKYKTKPEYAYKCFYRNERGLYPEFVRKYNINGGLVVYKLRKVYETQTAKDGGKYLFSRVERYKAGFHCFTTVQSAEEWIGGDRSLEIYKVKIDKIVAQGTQNNHRVVVAQQMQIIKKIRNREK